MTVENSLQKDLDAIYKYGQDWIITLNASITVQQTFNNKPAKTSPALSFGGEPIPIHNSHKHLGLKISEDLRFEDHANEIIKKVNRNLGPFTPLRRISRETF